MNTSQSFYWKFHFYLNTCFKKKQYVLKRSFKVFVCTNFFCLLYILKNFKTDKRWWSLELVIGSSSIESLLEKMKKRKNDCDTMDVRLVLEDTTSYWFFLSTIMFHFNQSFICYVSSYRQTLDQLLHQFSFLIKPIIFILHFLHLLSTWNLDHQF